MRSSAFSKQAISCATVSLLLMMLLGTGCGERQSPASNDTFITDFGEVQTFTEDRIVYDADEPPPDPIAAVFDTVSLSPDGTRVAFRCLAQLDGRRVSVAGICSMRTEVTSSDIQLLVTDEGRPGPWIEWCPEGKRLALDLSDSQGLVNTRLAIWDPAADTLSILAVSDPEYSFAFWQAWGPDGRTLAFARGTVRELWTVATDGSNLRFLTEGPAHTLNWSVDGSAVYFLLSSRETLGRQLWQVAVDSGVAARVRGVPEGHVQFYSVIDATSELLIAISRGDTLSVYLVDPRQGQNTAIDLQPPAEYAVANPPGDRVAYTVHVTEGEFDTGQDELWIAGIRGQSPERLVEDAIGVAWPPDGKVVVTRQRGREIWRIDPDRPDEPERIVTVGEVVKLLNGSEWPD